MALTALFRFLLEVPLSHSFGYSTQRVATVSLLVPVGWAFFLFSEDQFPSDKRPSYNLPTVESVAKGN